ncbi:tyrosine-type recombinase/integrase [Elizabethkingia anophelis]|nr:tyrosine-type recombinase/integrase [Elizabethkingia anophelis]MCT4251091.1 tyrosine-type recombinase/integrase [Elizabethkingia anophelis]
MKSFTEMKVYPKNWETLKSTVKKIWEIQYTFINNKGIEYPRRIKGMNHIKDHSERVIETKKIMEDETFLLSRGWNPITEEFEEITDTIELIHGKIPFLQSLDMALKTFDITEGSAGDMKNSLIHIFKYSVKLKLHLKDIQDVTKGDIKQLLITMSRDGHSNYRINKTRTHLSKFFAFFTELDIFEVNFIEGIKRLEHTPKVKKIIRTDNDWEKFHKLQTIHPRLHRFAIIFFYSGSRIEEMLGVTKDDVDLEKGIFYIMLKKGGKHIRTMRAINMNAYDLWQQVMYETGSGQYLFSHNMKTGSNRLHRQSAYKLWKKYAAKVDLHVTLYSLKYAFLNQVSKTFGLQKAQELAGHTTDRTTKIYALDYKEHQVERNKNIDIKIG